MAMYSGNGPDGNSETPGASRRKTPWPVLALLVGTVITMGILVFGLLPSLNLSPKASPSAPATPSAPPNTDPRTGWVIVEKLQGEEISKKCDGTTLVYKNLGFQWAGRQTYPLAGGVAVIADSPECK